MTKHSHFNDNKPKDTGSPRQSDPSPSSRRRIPIWQSLLLPLASVLIFFLLLEGGLALFGVKPLFQAEDPFVGFADNMPLYVPSVDGQQMVTAANKIHYFNMQSFPRLKAPGTYRIFSLGGSTTYGHPYADPLSFSGWMRELLPVADGSKHWEVINAGGISYASYRAAHLMEELINYQPDLFVVYTGHNEFLEERTYGQLRNIPPVVRKTAALLSHTRSWAVMTAALQKLGIHPKTEGEDRSQLRGEVNAILDRSAGLNRYTRDDQLRDDILQHYRVSLERMAALASSVGAKVIFVSPASNLKDCAPFKSEHTPGLDTVAQQRSEQMLNTAREAMNRNDWAGALGILDQAVALDPRHAELLYRRGQALVGLGRYDEAEAVLRQARDEDVCPLRALTPMPGIVAEVARKEGAGLIDYVELLRQHMKETYGYAVLGQEYFLDHVHPTIEAERMLAVALIKAMTDQGSVHPGAEWGEPVIARVAGKVEGKIDRKEQARALVTVARVLLWAGKVEDAERMTRQALTLLPESEDAQDVAADIDTVLIRIYQKQGQTERVLQLLRKAIGTSPAAMELRYLLGTTLLDEGPSMQLEEAAATLLLVCNKMPFDDAAYQYYGLAMAKRGRLKITYLSLQEAVRLNPNNTAAQKALAQLSREIGDQALDSQAYRILLDEYPSHAPRKLVQVRRDAGGRDVPDGIEAEWYENGRLKRFLDVDNGLPNGFEITWTPDGRLLSRVAYRNGRPLDKQGE